MLEIDLTFETQANALLNNNIRLKNSYKCINSLKIELNQTIISNENYVYYSNMIPHLSEHSKIDDLLYRGIDLHDSIFFKSNANKHVFMEKKMVIL